MKLPAILRKRPKPVQPEIIAPQDEGLIADLERRLREAEADRDAAIATIRQTDQLIWNMGQCIGWQQMRPHFQALLDHTIRRKELESNRIKELLIPEIRKVYTDGRQKTVRDDRSDPGVLQIDPPKRTR